MITSPGTKSAQEFAALCDERETEQRKQQALVAAARRFAHGYLTENPGVALTALADAFGEVSRDLWNSHSRADPIEPPQATNLVDAVPRATATRGY